MMGGCVLRDATGNVTAYQIAKNYTDPLTVVTNCMNETCKYGLQNDNQVIGLFFFFLKYMLTLLNVHDHVSGNGVSISMGTFNIWRVFCSNIVFSHC